MGEANATFSSLDPERSYAFETGNTSWRSRMTYDDGGGTAGSGANYTQGRLVKVEENTDTNAAARAVMDGRRWMWLGSSWMWPQSSHRAYLAVRVL